MGALIAVPDRALETATPARSALDVTIHEAESLPVAVAIHEAVPAPHRSPQKTPKSRDTLPAGKERQAAILTLPTQEAALEGSFPAAPLQLPERLAPELRAATAPAAVSYSPPRHTAPQLDNSPTEYPATSRAAGEEGTVTISVLVKRDGLPGRVEIRTSSGWTRLDAAARDAIRGWRFLPARLGADPVEAIMEVPVIFRLTDAGSANRDR